MEKKVIKKILALLMIVTILATDFFVLGSNLIAYAANQIETATDEPNIEFSAYFKDEDGTKEVNPEKSITNGSLKLYANIYVKNEGRFNDGVIEFKNSNFKLLSTDTGVIKDNKVNLNQIDVGYNVEIALEVEPIFEDKMPADMLLKTTVALSGEYISSENEGGETSYAEREVGVKYKVDESAKAELVTEIITNDVFSVNGTNKRIVQLLIKSRLQDNRYPVKNTKLTITVPELSGREPETVDILKMNERTKISSYEWTAESENVQIYLTNEADKNNKITWNQNGYDELVVTFTYPETVDASVVETTTNAQIELYNSTKLYEIKHSEDIDKEQNNIIIAKPEITTTELYKGQLYANITAIEKQDLQYNTVTTMVVTNTGIVDEIVVHEEPDKFIRDDFEVAANTKYILTEINKDKILNILGESGSITIKNGDVTLAEITNISEIENENIVINYTKSVNELNIITSEPINEGTLELKHLKAITGTYTRDYIREIDQIKTTSSVEGTDSIEILKNTALEIKETISKAELTVLSEGALSTTETNNLTLGITLVTNGEQYDLYKNPEIIIQLPTVVDSITFNTVPTIQNVNENDSIVIQSYKYDEINKQIKIKINGEQTSYSGGDLSELYIPLDLDITLSNTATTKTDTIIMTYKNENGNQYYGGTTDIGAVEQKIGIQAPTGLLKFFNLSTNTNTSISEDILEKISPENTEDYLDFEIALVNNTGSDLNNVQILGKLPTSGIEGSTLETSLRSLTAQNANIYFTENANAIVDQLEDETVWTKTLTSNSKLYLIKLDNLTNGNTCTASIKVQLPKEIVNGLQSYAQYEVTYGMEGETKTETSRRIALRVSPDLEVELTAQVGQQFLKNDAIVKEGEVIKYTATVINNTEQEFENVELKLGVPEGTVLVKPREGYVYISNDYYEEVTDGEKINEITSIIIPKLEPGEINKKQYEYEVRVNTDNTEGTRISNNTIATYNETTSSAELKNIIQKSDIRVTIKRTIDESIQVLAGGSIRYMVYIENLSDSKIENLEMQIISDTFNVEKIENKDIFLYAEEIVEKISIKEIKENDIVCFSIYGLIDDDAKEINTSIIVNDSEKEQYRSNTLSETFPYTDASISLTSSHNDKKIKQGDTVNYNITVKNTGDIEERITIEDEIPSYLQVQAITLNGNVIKQKLDETNQETYVEVITNYLYEGVTLKPQESAQLGIQTTVGYIPEQYNEKTITNSATVKAFGILKDTSEEVTHILQANVVQDENLENIISGFVWLDANSDGKKDDEENTLEGIIVKLYNPLTKSYLANSEGNIINTVTDADGEYAFTRIPNGSYIIVFEHNMDNYEPTINLNDDIETSKNSKAKLQNIEINGSEITVPGIEISNIEDNIDNMNLGLKKKTSTPPTEEEPENPDKPGENPEVPETPKNLNTIAGFAWLDLNRDGQKDDNETFIQGIKVRLYDVNSQNYVKNKNGNIVETTTDANGKYIFNNIEKGSYIVLFEYDIEEYEPTTYLADGVDTTKNSKVVIKKININGEERILAVTDTINVQENVSNINIGLKEKLVFDLELNKYITRIVVQTNKETKAYDYEDSTFEKVEIHRKQIEGALVVLEYTIKIKNNGEITGYAKNIVDYLPSGLTFSSELNTDWYLSGNYLYTKSLENVEIKPGQEKEIKLILTKTMTNDNLGLINNRAEIYQDYNEYGNIDIDSTPNNQVEKEDDIGSVDVIIIVSTGGTTTAYIILLIINMVLIGVAIRLMIKNNIIKISTKKERR